MRYSTEQGKHEHAIACSEACLSGIYIYCALRQITDPTHRTISLHDFDAQRFVLCLQCRWCLWRRTRHVTTNALHGQIWKYYRSTAVLPSQTVDLQPFLINLQFLAFKGVSSLYVRDVAP